MDAFFASGLAADLVIAAVLVELVALAVLTLSGRRPSAFADFAPNALAGLSLALAVRLTTAHAGWAWIAACLSAAGVAHVVDLARRLMR